MKSGKVIELETNSVVGDLVIHDIKMEQKVESIVKIDKIDLVTDEGFIEERNPDNSKDLLVSSVTRCSNKNRE